MKIRFLLSSEEEGTFLTQLLMECRALLIGYGNVYCHDDGVAFYIINTLRRRWGIRELLADEDGLDELGFEIDSIVLHQLVPEIIPVVADPPLVVFIDAHTGTVPEEVRCVQVREEHRFHAVTHHMSPGMVLGMVREMKGTAPSAFLVSVRGENFDFGLGLSDRCRQNADAATQRILDLASGPR
jgi:hydrogenase maturation protease